MILILLDLTAAFDITDHQLLLARLYSRVGLKGLVLKWFHSYLTNRYFSVKIGNCTSSATSLKFGLPQGSTLSPLLFSHYLLLLGSILPI